MIQIRTFRDRPDASEDLDIKKDEREDRNEAGEDKAEPVDVEPVSQGKLFLIDDLICFNLTKHFN